MLDLSTSHLPAQYRDGSIDGAVASMWDYGCLLWVPEDPKAFAEDEDPKPPAEVLAIQLYARMHACDFVLFDRDAEVNEDLETFQDE